MVREIIHDPIFLALKSAPASDEDIPIAEDLLDTLEANRETCVGMAANMIGFSKRILVFDNGGSPMVMINPLIVSAKGFYEAEESCLSVSGVHTGRRWKTIKVRFLNLKMQERQQTFNGFTAQIIQHEMDHFEGILI